MVVYLLVINFAVFILSAILGPEKMNDRFALFSVRTPETAWEIWRLITYQFLHGGPGHIFWNMLGLYFFGPPLERYWGSKKFLFFYLFCGVVGGLTFLTVSTWAWMPSLLIGASGAVLGTLAACAVLFPQMIIFLLVFPVPIRFAAILIGALSVLYVIWEKNLAEACHLGGMVAGVLYIKAGPLWQRILDQRRQLRRQTLLNQETQDQKVVDQILDKVHREGIHNLTRWEKRTLRRITQRQNLRDEMKKRNG